MQKNFTFFDQFRFLSKKKKLQYQTTFNTYETVHQILRNEPNRKISKKRKYIRHSCSLQRAEFYWNKKIIQMQTAALSDQYKESSETNTPNCLSSLGTKAG